MDTSNSAKTFASDLEEMRMQNRAARCIQNSLSEGMAEALYQPHTMIQPKPLASRVRDAGREILRHNQTCQWIQFIQETPQQPMESKMEKQPTPVETMPSSEIDPVPVKEDELIIPPSIEPAPFLPPSPPSIEDQLRCLQKQQEELLEQQHLLENQIEQQKKTSQMLSPQDLQPKPAVSETPEVESSRTLSPVKPRSEDSGAGSYPPTRFRRRLKVSCCLHSFTIYIDNHDPAPLCC